MSTRFKPTNENAKENEKIAIEWLTLLRSGAATKEQEALFFKWLEADPAHQQAFIQADELWKRGSALAKTQSQSSRFKFSLNLFSAQNKTLWLGSGLTIACTLAFVLVINPSNTTHTIQRYETLSAEQKTIELADGSTATLNFNSALTTNFSDELIRQVHVEKGEVFFKVSHIPQRPFVVNTSEGRITVLGTQFSVQTGNNETSVTVLSGKVKVAAQEAPQNTQQAIDILERDQQTTISKGEIKTVSVDAKNALAWRTGLLQFEGTSLAKVVKELNRYYGVNLQIGNDQIASLKVIAVLPLDKSLQDQIKILENSLNIVAVKDPATGVTRLLPSEL